MAVGAAMEQRVGGRLHQQRIERAARPAMTLRELVERGRVHNVMRLYWGKQLLPMLPDPREAFDFAVEMMDRYALDGRDPNTYTGVGWCFGLHDQPFPERAIFGKVRPMGLGALKKRFDVEAYAGGARQGSLLG